MNNRKNHGRRSEDLAVNIRVNSPHDLDAESTEIRRAMRELKKGNRVIIAPARQSNRLSQQADLEAQAKKTRTGFVTALSGGTALGLASLAFAPASIGVAAVAVAIGAALGGAATKFDAARSQNLKDEACAE